MIKRYIKQTWAMLKQHKLFGSLYIIGTAIPVALTMIVITFQYIRVGSIYPEEHRDELWCSETIYNGKGSMGFLSLTAVNKWFYPLQSAKAVTAIHSAYPVLVQLPDGKSVLQVKTIATDAAFFRVFDFRFRSGKPFSESDFRNGKQCAVISESLARRLFGEVQAVGRTVQFNYADYVVSGVVRDVSSLTPRTFAQIYIPYTCLDEKQDPSALCGSYTVAIRVDRNKGLQMRAEFDEKFRKYQVATGDTSVVIERPLPAWKYSAKDPGAGVLLVDGDDMVRKSLYLFGGLVLVFLLVPALNLSGMIAGRMEDRLMEMGVYKAFGATRGYLLRQVLNENLILTLMGGLVGLFLSWALLAWGKDWVFRFFSIDYYLDNSDILVTVEMLFSPWIFLSAFLICVVLNLASALLPVWHALRAEIVYSLNQKK